MSHKFDASLLILLTLLFFLGSSPAAATFQDFGYLNVFKVQRFSDGGLTVSYVGGHMKGIHNIQATIAEVPTYEGCEFAGAHFLGPADAASIIANDASRDGFKLMLNLQWVLFERTTFPCALNTPTRLRADWEQRLITYAQRAAGHYNSGNTAYMIIHSEVPNSPQVTQVQMVNVTKRARALFPGILATAGYPTDGGPLPNVFPWPLHIIFTWDYSVADPNHSSYVNGKYAGLVSRLRNQTIGVLVEGFGGDATAISGVYLGTLARRWCAFAQQQPDVEHIAGFYWGIWTDNDGTDYIIHLEASQGSTGIESAHRAVANAALNRGNGSCWAN